MGTVKIFSGVEIVVNEAGVDSLGAVEEDVLVDAIERDVPVGTALEETVFVDISEENELAGKSGVVLAGISVENV